MTRVYRMRSPICRSEKAITALKGFHQLILWTAARLVDTAECDPHMLIAEVRRAAADLEAAWRGKSRRDLQERR